MADPAIDPRLDPQLQQFSSLPPRPLAQQSYTTGPAQPMQNSTTPYYLPTSNNTQSRPSNIDPAFEQTSPTGPDESHDDDDHDDAELDGCVPRLADTAGLRKPCASACVSVSRAPFFSGHGRSARIDMLADTSAEHTARLAQASRRTI